jgi:hypothetical protein
MLMADTDGDALEAQMAGLSVAGKGIGRSPWGPLLQGDCPARAWVLSAGWLYQNQRPKPCGLGAPYSARVTQLNKALLDATW